MTPERWRQITGIFHAALSRGSSERSAYVAAACGDDTALRREVELMIGAHHDVGAFGETPPSAGTRRLAPGSSIGTYRVVGVLGVGGMGEVYRAHDSTLGRDVALKVLPSLFAADSERSARFEREARVLASLNHPNIAAIHGVAEADGIRALVLELVEGVTLAERIAYGPIPLDETLRIARQIADAVESAHEQGIIHRDLKPSNVKVRPDGTVKVLDFGLAKALDLQPATTGTMASTEVGVVMGTPAYMSPEQARGAPASHRTDVWAFGVILFEMITGRRPFDGNSGTGIAAADLQMAPNWSLLPPATPPALRRLLRRCLERDARARLRDIGDARLEIDELQHTGIDEQARGSEPADVAGRTRRRVFRVAAVLAGLALAATAYIAGTRRVASPAEVRLTLLPPEGTRFVSVPALSPDGRTLAFVAAPLDGHSRLWVRPLASSTARPIEGTDGAEYPFWSPDNRTIGFFADGKMWRIDVNGAAPIVICNASAGRGGLWLEDGSIVFAPDKYGALMRVAAAGGQPTALTTLDAAGGELSQRFPQRLPGDRILYFSWNRDRQKNGPHMIALQKPDRPVLALNSEAVAEYANGFLLFDRNGTLLAQPFNISDARLTGDPIPLGDVRVSEYLGRTVMSASDRAIVWMALVPPVGQLTWVSRDGHVIGTLGTPAVQQGVELSPNLKEVATSRAPDGIWVMDVAGATAHRVSDASHRSSRPEQMRDRQPVWSPDGRHIAFHSGAGAASTLTFELPVSPSVGGGAEPLVPSGTSLMKTVGWTPDGRTFVWIQTGSGSAFDIWAMPVDDPRHATAYLQDGSQNLEGRLSPDGRWLAHTTDQSGRFEVVVQSFPTADAPHRVSTGGGSYPRWRPDGRELYFLAPDSRLMAVAVTPGNPPAFSAPRPLFEAHLVANPARTTFAGYEYDVNADGSRFLINRLISEPVSIMNVIVNWTLER